MFDDNLLMLARLTLDEAQQKRLKIATAESCTGGLIAGLLTEIPGCSDYFIGGAIVYSNAAKARILGVDHFLLQTEGAVSAPVAAQMAQGARRLYSVDVAVSITGVAGPDGGTKDRPVGLVHVAVSGPGQALRARRYDINGPRETVRSRAACAALGLLKETLDGI